MVKLENVRAEMAKKRVTGMNLAKILGISQNAFYQKINGKRKFTADELGIIAETLEAEINFFYR